MGSANTSTGFDVGCSVFSPTFTVGICYTQHGQEAAIALGRKYRFDESHAIQVARLSEMIFDQLMPLHQLDRGPRRLLKAAALLHEIGTYVCRSAHHKHSLYLIQNSSLVGLPANELQIVANVARYHRKSPPKASHHAFQSLNKGDRQIVSVLSAILRAADALDRDHQQRVRDVRVSIDRTKVTLAVEAEGDLFLEAWSLRNRSDMFREVFGRKAVLQAASLPAEAE